MVLYIGDSRINFMLVEHLLMRWPEVTLLHAETGKDGVMDSRAAKRDLILLDMRLPDMDALDVLKGLRGNEADRLTVCAGCGGLSTMKLKSGIGKCR